MKISELKPLQKNPFKSTGDEQIKRIAKSIHEFERMMEIRKIVIDENNNILGGNKRYFALKNIGYKEIPDAWIEKVEGLTDEQKREFIVKDNAHWGSEWDYELLSEWNVDLEAWGVEDVEFADEKEAKEDDYEIPDEIETDIVLGDLIEIGEHRLLCGDSTDSEQVSKLMNGKKADMVFTDPPYALFGNSTGVKNVVDDKMVRPFFREIFLVCKSFVKLFGHIYVCCDWHSAFSIQLMAQEIKLTPKNLCIWDKGDGGIGSMYQNCYEMVWFFANSPVNNKTVGHNISGERIIRGKPNIWRFPQIVSRNRKINAQKPVDMISLPIECSSEIDELVLDLFSGSGSTMVAAHQLNRKCYGMEIEPKYCQIIIDRMRNLDPDIVIKKNGMKI